MRQFSQQLAGLQIAKTRGTMPPPMAPNARHRVCQRIKRLLEERGQTNRAFGQWMGHKDQWVSNLLAGRFPLGLDELDRAAAFLNVPPGDLIRIVDEPWELSPTEIRVVRALRMLPAPVRDHYMLLADYLVGVTPAEVDLLAKLRKLDPDELRRVNHWTDVTLFARAPAPGPVDLPGLEGASAPPAPAVRRRTRTK